MKTAAPISYIRATLLRNLKSAALISHIRAALYKMHVNGGVVMRYSRRIFKTARKLPREYLMFAPHFWECKKTAARI